MLDILLLILKIIGIILAVLLGLVILIVLIVLFAPVKYNIRASYYDNKPLADVRVTALFSLVRFKLTYIEELKYRVKVLFFTIYSSDKMNKADETDNQDKSGKKKAKDKNKSSSGEKEKGGNSRKNTGERNMFDETEENPQEQDNVPDSVSDSVKNSEGTGSSISQSLDNNRTGDNEAGNNETGNNQVGHEAGDNAGGRKESEDILFDKEEDVKEKRRENIFQKILKKLQELIERVKELYRSLKDKVVSVIESIRNKKEDLSEKIDAFYEVINNEDNRELVRFLWEQLKKLLKIIKPKKGTLYVHYGMDDPETTGKIAMYLAVLYGWLGIDINILPDFEQKIMEGEVQLKGSIRLFGIIVIALRVYTNKQFKKVVLKK